MRCILAYFALAVLVGGCRASGPVPAETVFPAFTDEGAFALVVGGDTTVLEGFSRAPGVLEGLVRPQTQGAKFGWSRYRVEFGQTGRPERADLRLGRVGTSPDSDAAGVWSVTIQDSVLKETRTNRPSIRRRVPVGTVPVFAPSMAMNHEVIRQAILRNGRSGSIEIPIYPMATDGDVVTVTVSWPSPDTAVVAYSGAPGTRFILDEDGRVLGSRIPEGEHVTVRLR